MKAHYGFIACALLLTPASAFAGLIVGIGYSAGPPQTTSIFSVDPHTGNTAVIGQFASSQFIAASSTGMGRTFFALSPVNVYRIDAFTGESVGYLCQVGADCTYSGGDIAYDPSNRNTYSLRPAGNDELLTQVVDLGPLSGGPPGSHRISYQPIGLMGTTGIDNIEYVPGLGLYGTSGFGPGYVIDETTGHATMLAPVTGLLRPITGLAFSFDTGQLLAAAGDLSGTGPGMIYLLDPVSGQATLLNGVAPNLVGIAYVDIPEPQTAWMPAAGLALCFALRRVRAAR